MLLQLENSTTEQIQTLLNFAKKNQLDLKILDEGGNKFFLPGKPLTPDELERLLKKSRNSGNLSLEEAHHSIRSVFNEG